MQNPAANFFRAARPEPPRCIGLQLRPYSLGHHIALHAYDSSFTQGRPRFEDLVLGVFICSQTWAGWEAWRSSWKLPIMFKIWGWFAGKFDVRAEGERFSAYITQSSETPEVAIPAKGRALSAPWESRLTLFLIKHLRLTYEQAMDFPIALAWQHYTAHGELDGSITLLSDADKETLDFVHSDRMKAMLDEAKEAAKKEKETARN